jgi:hypothetical protein
VLYRTDVDDGMTHHGPAYPEIALAKPVAPQNRPRTPPSSRF